MPIITHLATLLTDRNFLTRTLTALILAPLVVLGLMFRHESVPYILATLAFIAVLEASWMIFKTQFSNSRKLLLLAVATGYLTTAMIGVTGLYDFRAELLITLLVVTWSADIGAYIVGRVIGGPKLVPNISPNKTVSGALGGIFFSVGSAVVMSYLLYDHLVFGFTAIFIALACVGQLGDLLESAFKRYCGAKDSGVLLPGHGGVLDRLDSILLQCLVVQVIASLSSMEKLFSYA